MIEIFSDVEALMRGAAELFIAQAQRALPVRGRFCVALSGGKTPKRAYELLAEEPYRSSIDWGRVHLFWSDERCVPPDDARSNYGMMRAALLNHVPIPADNVHRIRGELLPADAAREYERTLERFFGSGPAQLDLVFLGLGTNGHTASLFPATPVLHERRRRVAEVHVAELDVWRVTLTAEMLNAAAVVAFLVSGAEKANVLREVIFGSRDPERLPAQLIQPAAGEARWLVDRAAAARLPASVRASGSKP